MRCFFSFNTAMRSGPWLVAWIGLGASCAMAQNASLSMPFGVVPSGQDRIRSADGVECQSHVGPRQKWMDMGVYSMGNQTQNLVTNPSDNRNQSIGVYARITINLDPPLPAIDCTRLYQLEIDRLRREVEDQQMNSKISAQPR